MEKQKIINKRIWGGMLTNKYFLILEDGTDIQVSPQEWETYSIGEEYPISPQANNKETNEQTNNC
jgi:ribosomal protein S2